LVFSSFSPYHGGLAVLPCSFPLSFLLSLFGFFPLFMNVRRLEFLREEREQQQKIIEELKAANQLDDATVAKRMAEWRSERRNQRLEAREAQREARRMQVDAARKEKQSLRYLQQEEQRKRQEEREKAAEEERARVQKILKEKELERQRAIMLQEQVRKVLYCNILFIDFLSRLLKRPYHKEDKHL
jgi:flagellar biosynthesis GTPase FlhF